MGGLSFPRKPWAYGDRVSRSVYRYSCLHIHFSGPVVVLTVDLRRTWNARLPLANPVGLVKSAASVQCFSPVTFSAQVRLTSELLRFL